jgi:RND family efflux transporter MFP subunit
MKRRLWRLSLALLILIIAGGVYLAYRDKISGPLGSRLSSPQAQKEAATIERFPVRTAVAQRRDLEVTTTVFGAISYRDKVEVASEIQGVLSEVPVQPGDLVRKGQTLAVMDTELLQAELKTKMAMKAQAEAQLHLAAWQNQALKKIFRSGGISMRDAEEAEARYHEKEAEVARFDAEIALIRLQIKKARITAPVDGIVGLRNYNAGERVPSQSERGVVTLMQMGDVYAEAEINEGDLGRLRPGLEAIVFPDAFPNDPVRGKIDRLEPVLRQESRSVVAKIQLPNPKLELKPGMFSRIEIVLDKVTNVLAIPTPAIRVGPDKATQVFVVADEVAFLRKVEVGLSTATWTEITSGLQPGEVVVVEGGERLRELSRVISTPMAAPPP